MKHRILVVDDDADNLFATKALLQEWGYAVDTVSGGAEAVDQVGKEKNAYRYSLVLLDYRMPDMDGSETTSRLKSIRPDLEIVMYSCDDSRETLRLSLRAGVFDFIEKDADPAQLKEVLDLVCQKVAESCVVYPSESDEKNNIELLGSIGLIGKSDSMARVAKKCLNYREKKAPVLILGETGTGKELVAKALHRGPSSSFFAINCAAFSESHLTESELFGYEKGAFTGADSRKAGILEIAGSGTVFLDEVDRLGLKAQGTLLRALREKKIRRVGALAETSISCRILAAAKPDLLKKVEGGEFLPDLYFRLNILGIEIPPLRERVEDIGPLVQHFCSKHEEDTGEKRRFSSDAIRSLTQRFWSGNVGELEGYVMRMLADSDDELIVSKAFRGGATNTKMEVRGGTLAELEGRHQEEIRKLLMFAIERSGSRRRAATQLGINESSLRTMVARLGIGGASKDFEVGLPQ